MKILAVLGLILAVSGTAGAIPFTQAYTGPVTMKFSSWDMGTLYPLSTPTTIGISAVDAIAGQVAPPGTVYDANSGAVYTGAVGQEKEDSWGIFTVTEIYKTGGNPLSPSDQLWLPGTGGVELTGIFYGLIDNAVAPGGLGELIQAQLGTAGAFKMYQQPYGTFAAADGGLGAETLGSAGRLTFSTYTGVTGGTLALAGSLLAGTGQIAGAPNAQFTSNVNIIGAPPVSAAGNFNSLVLLNGGASEAQFKSGLGPSGSDLTVQGTTYDNSGADPLHPAVSNWTVTDQDPVNGFALPVPEPLTMLGVFLGVGGLARYVRRRMA